MSVWFFLAIMAILMLGYVLKNIFEINAAIAPFIAISCIIIWMMFFGIIDMLWYGRILIYLTIFLLFLYNGYKNSFEGFLKNYLFTPACLAFCVGCIFYIIAYHYHQPFYIAWDEYSHWGPFYKSVFTRNQLHYFYDSNMVHQAYPQGATAFYYFTVVFANEFNEAHTFIAINIILIACVTTLFSGITWKERMVAFLSIFITPLFFILFPYSNPYACVYLDTLMGAVFGSSIIIVLLTNDVSFKYTVVVAISIVMMLCIKDIASILMLIIMAIYFIILLEKWIRNKNYLRKIVVCSFIPIIAGFTFLLTWKTFLKYVGCNQDQFSDINIEEFLFMVVHGDEKIYQIWTPFWEAIKTWPVLYNDSISTMTCFCLLLIIGVIISRFFIKHGKKYGIAISIMFIPLFCIAYILSIFYVYVCNMSLREALACASFQRYMSTFFIAWIMVLIYLLIHFEKNFKTTIYRFIPLGTMLFVSLLIISLLPNDPLTFSYTKDMLGRNELDSITEKVEDHIDKTSRVWVIAQGDGDAANESIYMYKMHYTLLPAYVFLDLPWNIGTDTSGIKTENDLRRLINEKEISHLLIYNSNDVLVKTFGSLFSDNLETTKENFGVLYQVNMHGDKLFNLNG